MTRSSPALRAGAAAASGVLLALTVCMAPAGTAAADSPEPSATSTTPSCGGSCTPEPTETKPGEGRTDKPKGSDEPPGQPGEPAPAPPAAPRPPATSSPAPPPSVTTVPAAPAPEEALPGEPATPDATATEPSTTPSATASTESNWNNPVTRSPKASQAASVTRSGGPGPGGPNPLTITAGVLLVGAGTAAFAWWGRSRFRAH